MNKYKLIIINYCIKGGVNMYDVAIIGAGVIGTSIFRELTKYNLKVVI